MTLLMRISLLVGLMACTAAGWGAPAVQDPYIGYVYPAGGQQGAKFSVTVGGQRLRNVSDVYVSGKGVRASVIDYQGPNGPLNQAQQQELRRRIQEIRTARTGIQRTPKKPAKSPAETAETGAKAVAVTLPDLPELRNLEQMTPRELQRVADKFLNRAKRAKPPIAEEVTLEVTVDADAASGDRELRLRSPNGLSNPLVFQVGQVPETREPDPDNDDATVPSTSQPPVVLNGQILPGEVDHFPLQLRAGQRVAVAVRARKLIPYLADAVPGWFQAVAALYDADGKELAFADDSGFDPDPAFAFKAPRDGQYVLEVRDALYRGRRDFVYRVDVGEASPIAAARAGMPPTGSTLPQSRETELNNTGKTAMRVTLPRIINGSIATPGDVDVFRFEGRAGDEIVAEVYARRMGSQLDSLLRLIDASGHVVALNDDHEDMESGLLTHHSDSYLSAKLPATGHYFVQVSDAQRHGGKQYTYSLRIGPPQPDFALRLTPSALNVPAGGKVEATLYAVRKDGWDGDIEVVLKDAPTGFALSGALIPKGKDQVSMTLTAPIGRFPQPIALQLEGRAQIAGKTVSRPVVAADNMMQAFAYHHLVPAEQVLVTVKRGGRR